MGLKKKFGDEVILDGIDVSIEKGEVVVVLGPSGCGKSIFLRCMNGLEMPTGGKILLDGEEVMSNGKKIARIRQRIGMVFQSYELFPHKNIMDNIILAPVKVQKRPKKEVELQAEQMHITRFWTDAGMHFLRIIRKFWHGRSRIPDLPSALRLSAMRMRSHLLFRKEIPRFFTGSMMRSGHLVKNAFSMQTMKQHWLLFTGKQQIRTIWLWKAAK